MACPELLCIDRQRQLNDNFEYPDFSGVKALQKEPLGAATLESLKKRPSRRLMLDQVLAEYTFGPVELRNTLQDLLRRAAERVGAPGERSTLGDPAFMTLHALNLLDLNNWPEVTIERADGTPRIVRQYVSPAAERRHLEALQAESRDRVADGNMQTALGVALNDPARSSTAFAGTAVEWARKPTSPRTSEDADDSWMRTEAVVIAAMIVMRDGDADLRARHAEWAREVFVSAFKADDETSDARARAGCPAP